MESRKAFGEALKTIRTKKGVSQESFSDISSRTYLSTLERGLKSPTLLKLEALSSALGVHDVTLLTLATAKRDGISVEALLGRVEAELRESAF